MLCTFVSKHQYVTKMYLRSDLFRAAWTLLNVHINKPFPVSVHFSICIFESIWEQLQTKYAGWGKTIFL